MKIDLEKLVEAVNQTIALYGGYVDEKTVTDKYPTADMEEVSLTMVFEKDLSVASSILKLLKEIANFDWT
ncbi:hypothetical protein FACS1894164_19300 [Spirochaetia bacterium]|nr:hypothetical protein FACS1894164_19300 [Spirochaetia bacterium]